MPIIRPITDLDIPPVVDIHGECLPTTTSSKIGKEYLSVLYKALLSQNTNLLLCAEEKGIILGIVTATPDLSQTSSFLTRYLYPLVLPLLLQKLLQHKISIRDLLKQMQFERALLSQFPKPYSTILTLCVSPTAQGKGIGRSLVETVTKEYKKHNIHHLYVDTLVTNKGAQKFYSAVGGKEVSRIHTAIVYLLQ